MMALLPTSQVESSPMPYRDLEPLSKQLTIVVGLTVVGFMAFGLALSFYRNVLFEQTMNNLAEQNDKLRNENARSQADLDYFHSNQFKDKYAKESLGKITPGEKELVITNGSDQTASGSLADALEASNQQAIYEQYLHDLPVIQHWQLYFFHRDQIDQLRKSL